MSRPTKIEYVLTHFPEVMKVNPYEDRMFVNKVKRALFMAGFYKEDADANYDSIVNLIRKMQGTFKQTGTVIRQRRVINKERI